MNKPKIHQTRLQPPKKPKAFFSTNNVLIYNQDESNYIVYFPGYLRVKFKNFLQIDLNNLTSNINVALIFSIFYGDFFQFDHNFYQTSEHLQLFNVEKLKNKNDEPYKEAHYKDQTYKEQLINNFMTELKLNFSRDSAILLSQNTNDEENLEIQAKHQHKDHQIKFTVRKTFHVHLDGDLKWSPFEVINSILQITVQNIAFKLKNKKYTFRINLMDHPDSELKLSFGQERTFGHYGLAMKLARAAYTNVKIEKSKEFTMTLLEREEELEKRNPQDYKEILNIKDVNIKYFQYALFNIPMYKFPLSSLVTVFIPLWLLGLINLGIYFQDQSLSDRIGSIIGLMLAFIAYIPTIEEAIPPSSDIVFTQGLVYMQSFASLTTFIHSMRIRNEKNFRLNWRDFSETPEYWITVIVTAGSFVMVVILMIIHYAYWEKKVYTDGKDGELKNGVKSLKMTQYNIDEAVVGRTFESPNQPKVDKEDGKKEKKKMLDRKTWSNTACDIYFNRFYTMERAEVSSKNKNNKDKQYNDYFILNLRDKPLPQIGKSKNHKNQKKNRAEEEEQETESILQFER